jgi:hypothetical protein
VPTARPEAPQGELADDRHHVAAVADRVATAFGMPKDNLPKGRRTLGRTTFGAESRQLTEMSL